MAVTPLPTFPVTHSRAPPSVGRIFFRQHGTIIGLSSLVHETVMTEELDRVLQTRAGRRVEYLSITWTSLEAIIGFTVGILAGSVALIGFGADSIIEVASSCVLLWWLAEGSIDRDRAAHRLVGACFFALAAYIAIDVSADLLRHEAPRVTYFGISMRERVSLSCLFWRERSVASLCV